MRLIDADALPIKFDGHTVSVWKNDIDNAPTVDAVPVVRCKDCKWWKTTEHEKCVAYDAFWVTDPDDFCSWGERREDEDA